MAPSYYPPSYYLGIDPGLHGALAFYDPAANHMVIEDMPLTKATQATTKPRIDLYNLAILVDSWRNRVIRAVIEQPHAMPARSATGKAIQGIASTWTFAHACGVVDAAVASALIPIDHVRPAAWKGALGLTSDKRDSFELATRLMPQHAGLWAKKSKDGRAEAALLAWICSGAKPR